MEFRIADTFTDSLTRLTGEEQKAAKTTAFDLQLNPASPGMQFHKLDRARDRNFWSVRVSRDIRLIVHRAASNLLLCYVDQHDPAYDWAEPSRQGSLDAPHVRDEAVRIPLGDREAFLQRREDTGY
jgi:mRNA-degrading endonuclease RelE of RelBE toxin-antitoxin system